MTVYIVAAKRTAIGKAKRGVFAHTRPDEMLADLMRQTIVDCKIVADNIDDVVIGCAFPEAEQGQNIARIATLIAGLPSTVPGLTLNRYCSSGLNAIAVAANAIAAGSMNLVVAGGVESMSLIPMGGNDWSVSPRIFDNDQNMGIAFGMGITAEIVSKQWNITRSAQDQFALSSNQKAVAAIANNSFLSQIVPLEITRPAPDLKINKIVDNKIVVRVDECPRADTNLNALAKLQSAFANNGKVTAGNSSQMSDGASVLILASESYIKQHDLKPLAKFLGFTVVGLDPKIMGVGPITAIPKILQQTGLKLNDISVIELNEAFAAQSLAVIDTLGLDINKVNPLGGAIAMGHPLGATGAILSTKLIHHLHSIGGKYGLVSMCVGAGMGAAGIFEACL
jgi:acetyl-CoA acyltransferase